MTQQTSSNQTTESQGSSQFDPSFHDLADFLPEAIIILDMSMNVVQINSAAEDLFGYAACAVTGQKLDIFLHEASNGFSHSHRANRLKKDGEATQSMGENRLIFGKHQDGHIIPLDMSLTKRKWQNQTFIVCIPRDISNQIAYQQALKENEMQFRNIFMEHSAIMLMVEPLSGRILEANSAASQFYGYSREELKSMLIDQINNMDTQQVAAERALAMTRKNNFFNFQHKLASGEIREVEVYSTPIESGGATVLFSIIHDNTERKRIEQALNQTSERLSLATRAGGIGIWDWDTVNDRLVWDDMMFRLYGITRDQFSGAYEAWQAGLHPEDREQGDREIQMALRSEKEFNIEFRVIWPDESIHTIHGMAQVQRDECGNPVRMIGTNWDVTIQKQSERDLSNQIALLSGLLDSIPEIVFFKDDQGKYLGCNPEFARFVGKPAKDLLNKTDYDLFDRNTADFFRQNDLAMMLLGENRQNEEWVEYPDGKRVLIDTLKAPLRDNQGKIIGLLGISRDITDRKLAEELALLERNAAILLAQKSTLAEALPHCLDLALQVSGMDCGGIYLVDRHSQDLVLTTHKGLPAAFTAQASRFTEGSEHYQVVMGGTAIYQPYLSVTVGQNQIDMDEALHILAIVPVAFEGRVIACLNVASHSLDDMAVFRRKTLENLAMNFGNMIARFQVQDDLVESQKELKRTLVSLQDSEARNSALLSAVPDLIFRIRRDGTLLDYKASSNDLLMIPSDQIIGASLDSVLGASLAEKAAGSIKQALKSKEIQTLEYTLKIGDSSHVFEARFKDSGEDEVTAIIRDISDRARLEQMKSDFINRATHELRTPIATMLLMVNLIDGGTTPDEFAEYWDILRSELDRERTLVEDLLSAGRLESDRLDLHFSSFNLTELINQITHQIELPARDKNITITLKTSVELNGSPALIHADEKALTQVLINLVGNAIKFTPPGGNIHIILQSIDSGFEISIIDTGIGIPSEDLPLLFTRFFRGSNAIENEIPGTGIGLFIVQSILEKHGGKIKAHSELGKGSQFDIWLPEDNT